MGIREAQRRLIEEYSERGYQFALGLCGNAEDAKELVQEAFYRVFQSWRQYDSGQALEGWFLGILKNVYLDTMKRYERRHGVSLDVALGSDSCEGLSLADAIPDPNEEGILDRLCRERMEGEVRRALRRLTPEHRAVLSLFDEQELTYEKIAEVLGCPLNTVRSRISRARAAFKKAILQTSLEVQPDGV